MLQRSRSLVVASMMVLSIGCQAKSSPSAIDGAPVVAPGRRDYDRSCSTDDDCAPEPECCPAPCTTQVVNRRELARVEADNAKSCPKPPQCVGAGGCRTHAYLCVKKACTLVYSDSPDYHPRGASP